MGLNYSQYIFRITIYSPTELPLGAKSVNYLLFYLSLGLYCSDSLPLILLSRAELYHWHFEQYSSQTKRTTYDGISARKGLWYSSSWWFSEKGVASKNIYDYLNFDSYKSECLSDPNLCHQGLSLSFWLRYNRKYLKT